MFDEERIPAIVAAYRKLNEQEIGEEGEKVRTLRQNLKTVEQKIANIVNVIANTGSAALVNQLNQLEQEKEQLDFQIQAEDRSAKEKDLNEEAIREAFRQARKLFHSGTLPQMEQLVNLYLDKVVVFPNYVEIHMNNIPSNLIPPSDRREEPASSGLHTFYIEKMSDKDFEKLDKVKNEHLETEFVVKLHRICKIQNKQTQKGQNKTQAQMALGLGKYGGAEPVPILEAWGQFPDESTLSSQLEEGVEQTNLRKLPLCRLIVKNPIDGIWLVGKDVLQGTRNGR